MSIIIMTAALSALVSWRSMHAIEKANGRRDHTYQVLDQVGRLVTAMVNQEAGIRGYLLSTDQRFLEPYAAGTGAYGESLQTVRARLGQPRPAAAAG